MAKKEKDGWGDGILQAIAIIGGALLFNEVLKASAKKEVFYKCPNCNNDIKFASNPCPYCHVTLTWDTPATR